MRVVRIACRLWSGRAALGVGLALAAAIGVPAAHAQLVGHGGPVRAVAVSVDGTRALSGSFDTSAILWSLRRNAAVQVLRFHESAVNAVLFLKDGRLATAGEDGRIALWTPGHPQPDAVLAGHRGPIVGLAVPPGGRWLASASWDRTVRLWPLAGGAARVFAGHEQNVDAVAFMPDGTTVVSAGYDATVRFWPLTGAATPQVVTLPAPLNALVVAGDGQVVTAGADGALYFLSPSGALEGRVVISDAPTVALALSRDGKTLAAANIRGKIAVVDRGSRTLTRILAGPGSPLWSAAFLPDNRTLLTGGADRAIRRWDVDSGRQIGTVAPGSAGDPLAAYAHDPGAQVFRHCVACHTLTADAGNRAGPSLHAIFGRRIATLPGYNYSPALKHLDIVWTPETVSKLFELGPSVYTPGTKMPDQRIGSASERAALVKFLERATK